MTEEVFHHRLKELQGSESDADFARRCGIVYTTMKRYLEGSVPGLDKAAVIAEANKVSLDWLYGRDFTEVANSERSLALPRFDVRASAGAGALVVSESVEEYFSVGRDWLRRNLPPWAPANATVGILEGSGDSMEPTIRDGDLIMVVANVERRIVERGGIFVLTIDNERLLLKRLQVLMNGDLKIISDNKAYEPETILLADLEHRVRILGQVFFTGGKPRNY